MTGVGERTGHFTAERYLALGECGILAPDDRVELLDGLIVAMPPPSPRHDTAVERVQYALLRGLGLDVSTRAHLIVEVALSSLPQDRLTKPAIYARAGVPCYWIVNLRDGCVEVYRDVDRWRAEYRGVTRAAGEDTLAIDDFPGVPFQAADFLPR